MLKLIRECIFLTLQLILNFFAWAIVSHKPWHNPYAFENATKIQETQVLTIRGLTVIQFIVHMMILTSNFKCNPICWCNYGASIIGFILAMIAVHSIVASMDNGYINIYAIITLLGGSVIGILHLLTNCDNRPPA